LKKGGPTGNRENKKEKKKKKKKEPGLVIGSRRSPGTSLHSGGGKTEVGGAQENSPKKNNRTSKTKSKGKAGKQPGVWTQGEQPSLSEIVSLEILWRGHGGGRPTKKEEKKKQKKETKEDKRSPTQKMGLSRGGKYRLGLGVLRTICFPKPIQIFGQRENLEKG